ncbi:MAG: ribose 5-phosphate isomerase B [Provencibacterium sp.]|jgi:ribose 5-phosphate isomerase B|nr:ribose 5-phosphate isomerase B [Provencibacterium sp.]
MIGIGADQGGFLLKQEITAYLKERGIEFEDIGIHTPESRDYPDIAEPLCRAVAAGKYEKGILICGTGIGMSMAANKIHGIRAALCGDCFSARFTRLHNDANVLCLGGRVLGPGLALEITGLFLDTPFEGGRHQRRVDKVMQLENAGD